MADMAVEAELDVAEEGVEENCEAGIDTAGPEEVALEVDDIAEVLAIEENVQPEVLPEDGVTEEQEATAEVIVELPEGAEPEGLPEAEAVEAEEDVQPELQQQMASMGLPMSFTASVNSSGEAAGVEGEEQGTDLAAEPCDGHAADGVAQEDARAGDELAEGMLRLESRVAELEEALAAERAAREADRTALLARVAALESQMVGRCEEEPDVEAGLLREARQRLQRRVAAGALANAEHQGDETELRKALAAAEAAGVESARIKAAEDRLGALAHQKQAARELQDAAAGADWLVLRNAISNAQRAKVPMSHIVAASRALEQLVSAGAKGSAVASDAPSPGEPGLTSAEQEAGRVAALNGDQAQEEMRQWSLCIVEQSLLCCRKRKALNAEDFEFAQTIKEREAAAATRLAEARGRYVARQSGAPDGAQAGKLPEELKRVRAHKRKAVEDEDFDLAAQLRLKELEVARSFGLDADRTPDGAAGSALEGQATQGALSMLRDLGPEALLLACHEGVSECLADVASDLWEEAAADLDAAAARLDPTASTAEVGATAGAPCSPEQ